MTALLLGRGEVCGGYAAANLSLFILPLTLVIPTEA
jgi:hypothetical protein